MNKKYEDYFFSTKECGIYSKRNVDGLFVVSDLEHCISFGKDTVTEKQCISLRSNDMLLDEIKICACHSLSHSFIKSSTKLRSSIT